MREIIEYMNSEGYIRYTINDFEEKILESNFYFLKTDRFVATFNPSYVENFDRRHKSIFPTNMIEEILETQLIDRDISDIYMESNCGLSINRIMHIIGYEKTKILEKKYGKIFNKISPMVKNVGVNDYEFCFYFEILMTESEIIKLKKMINIRNEQDTLGSLVSSNISKSKVTRL